MATPSYAGAQDLTLLTTKLYIPPPLPNLVERPRLVKRLDEGLRLGHRLTLISAPAGFGKTTLLSEWVHAMGRVSPPLAIAPGSRPPATCAVPTGAACPLARRPLARPGSATRAQGACAPGAGRTGWLSLDEGDNDLAPVLLTLLRLREKPLNIRDDNI
jgi:hypothetical protein